MMVLVSDQNKRITLVDARRGLVLWSRDLATLIYDGYPPRIPLVRSVTLDEKQVYVWVEGYEMCRVFTLRRLDGRLVWWRDVPGSFYLVRLDGALFLGSHAFSTSTGKWQPEKSGRGTPLSSDDNHMYLEDSVGIYEADPADGSVRVHWPSFRSESAFSRFESVHASRRRDLFLVLESMIGVGVESYDTYLVNPARGVATVLPDVSAAYFCGNGIVADTFNRAERSEERTLGLALDGRTRRWTLRGTSILGVVGSLVLVCPKDSSGRTEVSALDGATGRPLWKLGVGKGVHFRLEGRLLFTFRAARAGASCLLRCYRLPAEAR